MTIKKGFQPTHTPVVPKIGGVTVGGRPVPPPPGLPVAPPPTTPNAPPPAPPPSGTPNP